MKLQNAVANCVSYEMWNKLKQMFDNDSDTRLVALRTEMMKLKCTKDENILEYLLRLEEIQSKLLNTSAAVSDVDFVIAAMGGLPK